MAKALTVQSVERFKPHLSKRMEVADGLLPGLYFVLQPSGVRSWAVRYRHAGKPRKLTLGPYPVLELGAARTRAREALQVVALGRDPASEKQDALKTARLAEPGVDTVAAIVATFLERHARAKTKANTADDTERRFRLHVLPKWGERRIQDITRRDVSRSLTGLLTEVRPSQRTAPSPPFPSFSIGRWTALLSKPRLASALRGRARNKAGTAF